jgi:hypothetical protein
MFWLDNDEESRMQAKRAAALSATAQNAARGPEPEAKSKWLKQVSIFCKRLIVFSQPQPQQHHLHSQALKRALLKQKQLQHLHLGT